MTCILITTWCASLATRSREASVCKHTNLGSEFYGNVRHSKRGHQCLRWSEAFKKLPGDVLANVAKQMRSMETTVTKNNDVRFAENRCANLLINIPDLPGGIQCPLLLPDRQGKSPPNGAQYDECDIPLCSATRALEDERRQQIGEHSLSFCKYNITRNVSLDKDIR